MPSSKKTSLTIGDLAKNLSKLRVNQVLYVALIAAVFLLGYLFSRVQTLEKSSTPGTATAPPLGTPQAAPEGKVKVSNGALPVNGKENAKVTIVEFSDFECPFCERYFRETYPQIKKDYVDTGKVKIYFRHFPLDFHPAATPSALASECANDQGKFWEYHDLVYKEQAKIAGKTGDTITQQLKTWAQSLGLDTATFNQCLDNTVHQAKVDKDLNDGKAAGVSGTPTFFINGNRIVGAQPYASFKAIIDQELK